MNGREKLIEATRLYLRSNRKISLTRTEIAQGCGVTPALISYYFKDKRSLLDAVTKPLLNTYHARLVGILSAQDDARLRMHKVIRLLIELNTADGFLVDHMLRRESFAELDADDRIAVQAFRDVIADLVRELLRDGEWRSADPSLTEAALWGLCRAFGDAFHRQGADDPDASEASGFIESRIAFVYALFGAHPGGATDGT